MANTTTVEVSLLGSKTVKVHVPEAATVKEAIQEAAKVLGVTVNPDAVGAIVDGQQVDGDTPVADGANVTAAAQVANG